MKITSPAFVHDGYIPSRFTCQGMDISPELLIGEVPEGTKEIALIVDDPDAPMGIWVHWVVFNIPPSTTKIEEDSVPGKQGVNDFGRLNYGGPCPPSGTHRYFFKVYALSVELNLDEGITKEALKEAMEGHILDKAIMVGLYKKS